MNYARKKTSLIKSFDFQSNCNFMNNFLKVNFIGRITFLHDTFRLMYMWHFFLEKKTWNVPKCMPIILTVWEWHVTQKFPLLLYFSILKDFNIEKNYMYSIKKLTPTFYNTVLQIYLLLSVKFAFFQIFR